MGIFPAEGTIDGKRRASMGGNFEDVSFTYTDEALLLSTHSLDTMAQLTSTLRIIAQPKASHRERYMCETDRTRNRAQRFVRADDNHEALEYPTIEVCQRRGSVETMSNELSFRFHKNGSTRSL